MLPSIGERYSSNLSSKSWSARYTTLAPSGVTRKLVTARPLAIGTPSATGGALPSTGALKISSPPLLRVPRNTARVPPAPIARAELASSTSIGGTPPSLLQIGAR